MPPPAVDVTVLVTWLVMVPAVTVETVADGVVVRTPARTTCDQQHQRGGRHQDRAATSMRVVSSGVVGRHDDHRSGADRPGTLACAPGCTGKRIDGRHAAPQHHSADGHPRGPGRDRRVRLRPGVAQRAARFGIDHRPGHRVPGAAGHGGRRRPGYGPQPVRRGAVPAVRTAPPPPSSGVPAVRTHPGDRGAQCRALGPHGGGRVRLQRHQPRARAVRRVCRLHGQPACQPTSDA